VTTGDRARAVLERLARAAEAAGVPDAGARRVTDALALSLERRARHFRDPQHTDFLHPARTALILLHDTPLTDADALTAAVLFDSERRALTFDADEAAGIGGERAGGMIAALPIPAEAADLLLERLVAADEAVRLIALAERLDHVRRLHLRPTEWWQAVHDEIEAVYLPVAERTDATLARRFRWWADMFAERYL
jgi:(p)ppGpp synthase/HD superfamily hydrolase